MLYQVVIGTGPDTPIFYVEAEDQKAVIDHVWKLHKPILSTFKITIVCLAGKIEKAEEKNKQEAADGEKEKH